MVDTTHLKLPYLEAAQAQKHVTVNESLRLLDALVHLAVVDRDLTAPPGSPTEGARYIVASGATGAWASWDLNVAAWLDGAWTKLVPEEGWRAWVTDEDIYVHWDGSAWVEEPEYEVGTFTPAPSFATPGDHAPSTVESAGRYEAFGKSVRILLMHGWTHTHTTASGQFRMGGLPFASVAGTNRFNLLPTLLYNAVFTGSGPMLQVSPGSTFGTVACSRSGNTNETLQTTGFPSGATTYYVWASGMYERA